MKRLICLFLLTCMAVTCMACNRRDQYRDPIDTGTTTSDFVTEVQTDKTPGANSVQLTEGNPYATMSPEELLSSYRESLDYAKYSSDIATNTPYYYIFSSETFGMVQ